MLTGVAVRLSNGAERSLDRLRARAVDRLSARLPVDVRPTALALLLAERDEIAPELRRQFAAAGLAHLLAISGMHVGLLAAGTGVLLGLLVGPRRRMPLTLLLVGGYVVLIGAPPAACRALVVFAGYVWSRMRGWPVREGELLGTALLVALVAAPGDLLEPGLQLSFMGFAGVIGGTRAAKVLPIRQRRLRTAVRGAAASLGAVLATTPFTAYHFGQVTPVSLVSHFAGGPLVGAALGGLVATLTLPGALSAPAADVATGALRGLHAVAEVFGRLPGGHRAVAAPSMAGWLAWLLALEALRRTVARGRPRAALPPLALAAASVAAVPLLAGIARGPALLCTLSVGQGDAAVLRTGQGRWLVFDGGPAWGDWNAGRSIVHPFIRRHAARRVTLAVLSHPDLDHLGGLQGLLPLIDVERLLDSGDPVPSSAYADFLAEVDAAGVTWLPAAAGDRLRVDDVDLTVLGPMPPASGHGRTKGGREGANATSLAFRLTVGGRFHYVNTGDATQAEEAALVAAWPAESLRADVLKVGHHGSRTSSGAPFLRAVDPAVAVISAGARNRYGHPHAEVLARLRAMGTARIWRTDRHGTLCVEIAGDGRWRVRGEHTWRRPGESPSKSRAAQPGA
jgi:competence protein ComEC